jgi:hypothetical protein
MAKPFIPNRDSDLDPWLQNFAGKIAANPAAYGLKPADGTQIAAVQAAWHAAYQTAVAPSTRTALTIKDKDNQRAAAVAVARRLAGEVRSSASVSLELKLSLGLRVRKDQLTRTPPPTAHPILHITGVDFMSHQVRATNPDSPDSPARPAGAASLLVVRTIADAPAKDPLQATFLTIATRTIFTSQFTHEDGGRYATYFARWANGKGELGPWSGPVSMRIAA